MRNRHLYQYGWALALPLVLAVLFVVRTPALFDKSGGTTSPPLPSAPSADPTTGVRSTAPAPQVSLPSAPLPMPLPPVVDSGAAIPGAIRPPEAPANPAPPPAPATTDPRFGVVQQSLSDGDVAQAQAQLRQLLEDGNAAVAAHAQFLLGQTMLAGGDRNGAQTAFQQYLAQNPSGPDAPLASFALAEVALQQGNRADATTYFQQYLAHTSNHALDGYGEAGLAQVAQDNGDAAGAVSHLQRAVEAGIPLDQELKAATTVGTAMTHAGRLADAANWYASLAGRPANDPATRGHYQVLEANVLQQEGKAPAAIAVYQQLIHDGTAGTDTGAVIAALQSLGQPVSDFAAGEAYLKAGQFDRAVASLGDYLDKNPDGPDASTARLDRGRALMDQNDFGGAAAQLDRFVAKYPGDRRLGAAALLEGQALQMAGQVDQAVAFLQTYAQQHPTDPNAPQALWNAVQYLRSSSEDSSALQLEQHLMTAFPTTSQGALAAFDVGWADYENLDFAAAKGVWQSVRDHAPATSGSAPALLWLGKLAQRAGNAQEAQADFHLAWQANPGDYYAFRARELADTTSARTAQPLVQPSATELAKERADLEAWLVQWTHADPQDTKQPYAGAPISEGPTLDRIRQLAEVGLGGYLQDEIKQAMNQYGNDGRSLYALADALSQVGQTAQSMAIAYHLLMVSPAPNSYQAPLYLQRLVYPFPYRDLIVSSAQKYHVDPLLLVSLIRQESAFDTRARSSANAIGLTQFMPDTASGVAAQVGLANFDLSDLYQPPVAIQLGTAYLASQTRAFGGNPYFALAAYNAGSGSVMTWLSDNPRHDLDLLVEEIPFKQTQDYVRNIYRFYQEYQILYR